MADGILGWIQLGLAVVGLVAAILLPISYKFSPVRTVRAKVVDKSKVEFPSKYGTNTKYTVVFQTEGGKRLSFYVSEFSYGGYRRGESGMLKYQGNRIIGFC